MQEGIGGAPWMSTERSPMQMRSRRREPADDQAVEAVRAGEAPSEVRGAAPADGDLPGAAGEPAPIWRRTAHLGASGRLGEAGDHVLAAVGVAERPGRRAIERDAMAIARDFGSACRATPDAIRLRLRRSAGLLGLFPQHERIVLRTLVAFRARRCHGCGVLDRPFRLPARRRTPGREARGALATFLTMAYILFANPAILAAAGMPKEPVVAATAAASALTSLMMGLGANFPIALAPGMGLNAVIAYQVAPAAGSWQTAMGLVVLDGLTMLVLVLIGFREALMRAIPRDLRRAIGVGIGLFIAFIGLVNARVVIVPAGTIQALPGGVETAPSPGTVRTLRVPDTAIALAGLLLIAALLARRVKGAILIGIALGTILALAARVRSLPPR